MSATAKRETAATLLTSRSLTSRERVDPRANRCQSCERRLDSAGFETGPSNQGVHCIPERHPPLEHHPTRARHREQVAVPGRLGRVAGQRAMPAMITNELFNVDEESHRITSSARNSTDDGIVSLSAVAVLRLITSSNFVSCSTGRSAGLAPLRILSTYSAACRNISERFGAYDIRPPT